MRLAERQVWRFVADSAGNSWGTHERSCEGRKGYGSFSEDEEV